MDCQNGNQVSGASENEQRHVVVVCHLEDETDEGAVADILSGDINDARKDGLYVSEKE